MYSGEIGPSLPLNHKVPLIAMLALLALKKNALPISFHCSNFKTVCWIGLISWKTIFKTIYLHTHNLTPIQIKYTREIYLVYKEICLLTNSTFRR